MKLNLFACSWQELTKIANVSHEASAQVLWVITCPQALLSLEDNYIICIYNPTPDNHVPGPRLNTRTPCNLRSPRVPPPTPESPVPSVDPPVAGYCNGSDDQKVRNPFGKPRLAPPLDVFEELSSKNAHENSVLKSKARSIRPSSRAGGLNVLQCQAGRHFANRCNLVVK